ncbi:hypothetical protein [Neoroseomonas oryzicola]|uniref:Uncharacterized protein n=1 Tax=Neoroseomonas oryzicola TaxID=535904 RepID=A0A9X9WIR1_9PROT|nr:hypothetical protein [Neoroseomonas oryzicola]MBR0660221.1 hypothetical protein [Neoroseomonas oryzicola]NKE16704.1 hypothetical protein [Neoroseomonas oryzicola]
MKTEAETTTSTDAAMIALCAEYRAVLDRYDAGEGPDGKGLWDDVMRLRNRLEEWEPQTIEGVVALARIAMHEAQQPDGSENFGDSFTGAWPELVVRGVLRVAGRAQMGRGVGG